MDTEIIEQINEVLKKIRPFLKRDGGDVEFKSYDEETHTVYITLTGACIGCTMIDDTLHLGIEAIMIEEVPGVLAVKLAE